MTTLREINCTEATSRAAFFVLGALDSREALEVREHLETCSQAHEEFAEIGGVVSHLADLPEEVEPSAELRERILGAVHADVRARSREVDAAERLIASFETRSQHIDDLETTEANGSVAVAPVAVGPGRPHADATARVDLEPPFPPLEAAFAVDDLAEPDAAEPDAAELAAFRAPFDVVTERTRAEGVPARPPIVSPAVAAVSAAVAPVSPVAPTLSAVVPTRRPIGWFVVGAGAVLLLAGVVAWNVLLQVQIATERARAQEMRDALVARNSPNAIVAVMTGTASAPNASATAVMPPGGPGYLIVQGLDPAPPGKAYQAWYLSSGDARSAGVFTIEGDGIGLLSGLDPGGRMDAMSVTLETAGGADKPTQEPLVSGKVGR